MFAINISILCNFQTPLRGTELLVLLKSCQVESEQQRLQDLNQEHTQNLLVSDCTVRFTYIAHISEYPPPTRVTGTVQTTYLQHL